MSEKISLDSSGVILKEESSFISLEVSMSFAILWPNWLRLTPYTSYGS